MAVAVAWQPVRVIRLHQYGASTAFIAIGNFVSGFGFMFNASS
jgi:hypothetical protein